MQNETTLGTNRTGAQMSPLDTKSMSSYAERCSPMPDDPMAAHGISEVRADYAHEAEAVGSVPLPGSLTGAAKTGMAKLAGRSPEVLIDKLGERLAFERSGVRLYQALIDKCAAMSGMESLPFQLADLEHNRDEELEHMQMCIAALQSLGADPTAQTPSADIAGVATGGVMQVVTDPRTTLGQCLTAMLTAELADNASWQLLIELTRDAGQDKLIPDFQHALTHEEEHAQRVQSWLATLVRNEAGA